MAKKGAMELSIGTIVIIVLAMSMLILGLMLTKNLFTSANKVVKMTDDQLLNEMKNLFGDNKDLSIYPDAKILTIKQGELTGFGIGIKNLGTAGSFSYEVKVDDPDLQRKCNVNEQTVIGWIITGRASTGIQLGPGSEAARRVLLQIPEGSALCTFRLGVTISKPAGTVIASDAIDIEIKA